MQANVLRKIRPMHMGVVLQLFLSHLLVSIVVQYTSSREQPGSIISLLAILLTGAITGVLLTANLSSCLSFLHLVLGRMAQNLPVEIASPRWNWPLRPLIAHLKVLKLASHDQSLLSPQTREYRDQLSLQVRKTAAQEERNRLARDLHDSIKQQIFSIAMSAAAVKARWTKDPETARHTVEEIERTAHEAQVEMQALLQELRPVALENVGLIEALRMQCQALGYRTGARVTTEFTELPAEHLLPPGSQELLFRIVQEAFSNIARHAQPQNIWLSLLRQQDALLVEIGDDGEGFARHEMHNSSGGMGLKNIHERITRLHGHVNIWSRPGEGTTLHFYLPLTAESVPPPPVDEQVLAALKKASLALTIGWKAVEAGALVALLYLPAKPGLLLAILWLFVALAALFWSHFHQAHVALGSGRASMHYFQLQAQRCGLLVGVMLLCFATTVYSIILTNNTTLQVTLFPFSLCTAGLLASATGYFFYQDRAYRSTPSIRLGNLLRQKVRELFVEALVWGLATTLTFLFAGPLWRTIEHLADNQAFWWIVATGRVFLVVWVLAIAARLLQNLRWHWHVREKSMEYA